MTARIICVGEMLLRMTAPGPERLMHRIDLRDDAVQTDTVALFGIVDRIGSGDAFAAGIMHGVLSGEGIEGAMDVRR